MSHPKRFLARMGHTLVLVALLLGQTGAALPVASAPVRLRVRLSSLEASSRSPAPPVEQAAQAPASPTACTNPESTVTLARDEEIIMPDNQKGISQYHHADSAWAPNVSTVVTQTSEFDAVVRNRQVEVFYTTTDGNMHYVGLHPDVPLNGQGVTGQIELGKPAGVAVNFTFIGRPAAAVRTPHELWVFGRGADHKLYFKVYKVRAGQTNLTWDPEWQSVEHVSDAASSPAVVFRDENHLTLFYKDSSNNVWFTERAVGEWSKAPINLGQVLDSDVTAVSMNTNHVALVGVNSGEGKLYVRQWTADKKPDWSNADAWETPISGGVNAHKPAAAVLGGNHFVVAAAGVPSPLVSEYYSGTWRAGSNLPALALSSPLALVKTNANALMLAGVDTAGQLHAIIRNKRVPEAAWDSWLMLAGKYDRIHLPVLVAWAPGGVVALAADAAPNLYAISYTAQYFSYTYLPKFKPAVIQEYLRGASEDLAVLAKSNDVPYLVWAEVTGLNFWTLKSRANPIGDPPSDVEYWFGVENIYRMALIAEDVTGDGNEEAVVAFTSGQNMHLVVINPATAHPIGRKATIVVDTGFSDIDFIPVAAGDLDGDGKKNEIAVAYLTTKITWPNNSWRRQLHIRVFRLEGTTLSQVASYYQDAPTLPSKPSPHFDMSAIALAAGRFDPSRPNQDLLAVGRIANRDNKDPSDGPGYPDAPHFGASFAVVNFHGLISGTHTLTGPLNQDKYNEIPGAIAGSWHHDNKHFSGVDIEPVDLDGDTFDEIALLISRDEKSPDLGPPKPAVHRLITARFDGRQTLELTSKDKAGNLIYADDVGQRIYTGDLDGDGHEEIIGHLREKGTKVFRQKVGSPLGQLQLSYTAPVYDRGDQLIIGDIDNDSVTLVADGCEEYIDVVPLIVLNAPPRWYNEQGMGVSYGKSKTSSTAKGSTYSHSNGGFLEVGVAVELNIPLVGIKAGEVRASVTNDFAFAKIQSKEDSESNLWKQTWEVDDTGGEGKSGIVVYSESRFRCYFFRTATEPVGSHSVRACSHLQDSRTYLKPLVDWYDPAFKARAGSSWAPVGVTNSLLSGPDGYEHKRNLPPDHFPVVKEFLTPLEINASSQPGTIVSEWERSTDKNIGTEESWETNLTVAAGATVAVVTVDAGYTHGLGGAATSSVTEGTGDHYTVKVKQFKPTGCPACRNYDVWPYIYLRTVKTDGGQTYPVHELDYYVNFPAAVSAAATTSATITATASADANALYLPVVDNASATAAAALVQNASAPASTVTMQPAAPGVAPLAPLIISPTHDPAVCKDANTVTLNWSQPPGDPASVAGYDFIISPDPDYALSAFTTVTDKSKTYTDVADGVHYFNLVARSNSGELSPRAQRAVCVDTQPPQILSLNLSAPANGNGWHNQPLVITPVVTDTGSGVARVEYSKDGGASWEPVAGNYEVNADTPLTTLWARAVDQLAHVSAPVSVTYGLDLASPSSRAPSGQGLSYVNVVTTATGNRQLVLGGVLADNRSGPATMHILIGEEQAYHTAQAPGEFPVPPGNQVQTGVATLNWVYTPTLTTHGSYAVRGYAEDLAGNAEDPYELGSVTWPPTGQPDIAQTVVSAAPAVARPGDIVTFTVAVRNIGTQESSMILTDTLPGGLTILPDTISHAGEYLAGSNAVRWRLEAAWPGATTYLQFSARVAANPAVATNLVHTLRLQPYWPDALNVIQDPVASQVTGIVTVQPAAVQASAADTSQPRLNRAWVEEGAALSQPAVTLFLDASPDAAFVYVREYTLHPSSGAWQLAQERGWLPFTTGGTFTVTTSNLAREGRLAWTLSPGDGVKQLEVRVANAQGRSNNPNEGAIIYTNLLTAASHTLAANGDRAQYRLPLAGPGQATLHLKRLAGEAAIFVWRPNSGARPDYVKTATITVDGVATDVVEFPVSASGPYVVEVHSCSPTPVQYRLEPGEGTLGLSTSLAEVTAAQAASPAACALPNQPATLGTPILQALQVALPGSPGAPASVYLPLVRK